MNAGRDVERQISAWLTDEATDRSRDRVLAAVHQAVERMPQRRFGAGWRDPMFVSPSRLALMAAALVVAVLGGAMIGRMSAPGGSGAPAPTPTGSPVPGDPLLQYRLERNTICNRYFSEAESFKVRLPNLYSDDLSDEERAEKVDALEQVRRLLGAQAAELAALDPPAQIASLHARSVAQFEDINRLIDESLRLLGEGNLAGAEAVDLATDPIAAEIGSFEEAFELAPCA